MVTFYKLIDQLSQCLLSHGLPMCRDSCALSSDSLPWELTEKLWTALWNDSVVHFRSERRTSLPKHHSQDQKRRVIRPVWKEQHFTVASGLLLVTFLLHGTTPEVYTRKNPFNTPMLTPNERITGLWIKQGERPHSLNFLQTYHTTLIQCFYIQPQIRKSWDSMENANKKRK